MIEKVIHAYDITLITFARQLLGEYGHDGLIRCVRDESCRDLGDAAFNTWTTNRMAVSALLLTLAPVALILRSYGGASTLVAVAGWVLSDGTTLNGLLRPRTPRAIVASVLLAVGLVSFAITFVVLFLRTW